MSRPNPLYDENKPSLRLRLVGLVSVSAMTPSDYSKIFKKIHEFSKKEQRSFNRRIRQLSKNKRKEVQRKEFEA